MLYDFINEAFILESEELNEDKMVKYDGELSPKFGWCAIYIGGPASGKGTATKFLSRLEGDYFNVDNLKEIERMWQITDPKTGKPHSDNFKTPSEIVPKLDKNGDPVISKERKSPWTGKKTGGEEVYYDKYRNMGNSDFVSELHAEMKPLGKKWQNSMLHNPENETRNKDRLPNLIFDITGDDPRKIMKIIDPLKAQGYKIAILWMLTTPEKAILNNFKRDRSVEVRQVLLPKHKGVMDAVEDMFSSDKIKKVDEFWVIDTDAGVDPFKDPVGYHNAQNVYHIPIMQDGIKTISYIADRIATNREQLNTYGF